MTTRGSLLKQPNCLGRFADRKLRGRVRRSANVDDFLQINLPVWKASLLIGFQINLIMILKQIHPNIKNRLRQAQVY